MILRRHQLPGKTRSCKTTQVLIVTWGHRTWQWDWVTDPLSGFKNFASLFSRNYLPPTPCLYHAKPYWSREINISVSDNSRMCGCSAERPYSLGSDLALLSPGGIQRAAPRRGRGRAARSLPGGCRGCGGEDGGFASSPRALSCLRSPGPREQCRCAHHPRLCLVRGKAVPAV